MNKKIFLYSLASVSILASCSDEIELQNETASQPLQKGMVKAGLLSVGTSSEDGTRAYGPQGPFVWMPETMGDGGALLAKRTNQQIGLCWTGVNTVTPGLGSQASATTNVYTNYMYEHIGWLNVGETAADVDECTGNLLNGAYIVEEGLPWAAFEGSYNPELKLGTGYTGYSTRFNGYYYDLSSPIYIGQNGKTEAPLNLGTGVFKTENSSVFEGQYVIYFPYTDQFTKGPIVANEPDAFTVDVNDDVYATASKHAFQLGYVNHYDGGHRSANFSTKNYASFADVTISLAPDVTADHEIKNVVLYSKSEKGIIYQTGVSAQSVILANGDMKKVEKVESDKDATTNAIFATLYEGADATSGSAAPAEDQPYALLDGDDHNTVRVVLPVIPQTVDDLQVILIDTDNRTCYYDFPGAEFVAGTAKSLPIVIEYGDFANNYIAVDEPTLVSCFVSMYNAGGGTVKILRSIDLIQKNDTLYKGICPENTDGTFAWKSNTTITADESNKDAKLTLKATKDEDGAWNAVTRKTEAKNNNATLTINVPVIVEGPGCCATEACELYLGGQDAAATDNIEIKKTLTNYGHTYVSNNESMTKVTLADVLNYYDDRVHEGEAKSYVAEAGYRKGTWMRNQQLEGANKKPMFIVSNTTDDIQKTYIANIVNEGEIEFDSEEEASSADSYGLRSNEVFVSGNIINNGLRIYAKTTENQGELEQATDENDIAGGQISISENSLVVVNGYVENNRNIAVIEISGVGESETTDGRIDIKSAGNSKNTGTFDNAGVANLTGGNLNNGEKGLFIDHQTAQVGGKPVDNGSDWNAAKELADYNKIYKYGYELDETMAYITDLKTGIYVAQAENPARLAFIVNDPVISKSTNVIEIVAAIDELDFNTPDFKGKDFAGYDVRINQPIKFRNYKKNAEGLYEGKSTLGHCVDVLSSTMVNTFQSATVENNLIVRNEAEFTTSGYQAELNIGNNIFIEDGSTVTINAFTKAAMFAEDTNAEVNVGNDIRVDDGSIELNKKYTVENDVKVASTGVFDSNSDANTVGNNFELEGDASFAKYTTTTINNTFNSYAGSMFTREALSGDPYSRATVNCTILGKTEGSTITGWPTELIAD